MNFTPEQLTKAKKAKSVEELIALAKESGMELTEAEAAKYFAELHKDGELSDEELGNVSGGCGGYSRPTGQVMALADDGAVICPFCKGGLSYGTPVYDGDESYDPVWCYNCQVGFRHYWTGDQWTKNE